MSKQIDISGMDLPSTVVFGGGPSLEDIQDDSPAPSSQVDVIPKEVEEKEEVREIAEVVKIEYQDGCIYKDALEKMGIGSRSYLERLAERIKERPAKTSTGIKELDEVTGGGWPCGISVVAALPNVGKTTILLQSAAAMAMQGTAVIYLTHDMRELDLTAKTISHTAYKLFGEDGYTLRDILGDRVLSDGSVKTKDVIGEVERTQKHLFIRDLIYDPDFDAYCNSIKELSEMNRIHRIFHVYSNTFKNVIFICDSLQQIAAYNKGGSGKDSIDKQLQEFKQLSTYYEVPLILISTLNRNSYAKAGSVDFSGLKESGSIEYDSDNILVLFPKMNKEEKDDFTMDEFRSKEYRDVTIKCIKSRDSGYMERTMTLYAPGCTFISYEGSDEEKADKPSKSRGKKDAPPRIPPSQNYS